MKAEDGINEINNNEGQRNPFVQDFLLQEQVEHTTYLLIQLLSCQQFALCGSTAPHLGAILVCVCKNQCLNLAEYPIVNYLGFSFNPNASGAEWELVVLQQNPASSVMAFDSLGPNRENLLTWNPSASLSHRKNEKETHLATQTLFERRSSLPELSYCRHLYMTSIFI